MENLKISSIFTSVLFVFLSSFLIAQENDDERYRGIEIGSETRTLESKINDKKYKLYINLPEGYSEDTTKEYPVFYILDGQWNFSQIVSIYGGLYYDGMLPEILIVGITWDGKDPNYQGLRGNDFTPTSIPQLPTGGGANKFIEVIRDEIIPFIDNDYRTNKVDRALAGSSLGGLFTHYLLFNEPELFNGFVLCNPSLWFNDSMAFKYEGEFAKDNSSIQANVFMVSGEYDSVAAFQKMVDQINSRAYRGLQLESRILDGMGHGGSKPEGYSRGMLSVYKRQIITLTESALKEYTGTYEYASGRNLNIEILAGDLVIKTTPE